MQKSFDFFVPQIYQSSYDTGIPEPLICQGLHHCHSQTPSGSRKYISSPLLLKYQMTGKFHVIFKVSLKPGEKNQIMIRLLRSSYADCDVKSVLYERELANPLDQCVNSSLNYFNQISGLKHYLKELLEGRQTKLCKNCFCATPKKAGRVQRMSVPLTVYLYHGQNITQHRRYQLYP